MSILSGCDNDVDIVTKGTIPFFSNNVSVGDTVNLWSKTQQCSNMQWSSFTNEKKEKIVQFICDQQISQFQKSTNGNINTGELTKKYNQAMNELKGIQVVIQFILSVDLKSFDTKKYGVLYTFKDGKRFFVEQELLPTIYTNKKYEKDFSSNYYLDRK